MRRLLVLPMKQGQLVPDTRLSIYGAQFSVRHSLKKKEKRRDCGATRTERSFRTRFIINFMPDGTKNIFFKML